MAYVCTYLCGETFTLKYNRDKHMRKFHVGQPQQDKLKIKMIQKSQETTKSNIITKDTGSINTTSNIITQAKGAINTTSNIITHDATSINTKKICMGIQNEPKLPTSIKDEVQKAIKDEIRQAIKDEIQQAIKDAIQEATAPILSRLEELIKLQGIRINMISQINLPLSEEDEESELLKEFLNEERLEMQRMSQHSYIYILEGMDMNTMRRYYKVGETQRHPLNRMKEHGRQNKLILMESVKDSIKVEKAILEMLRANNQIISRTDLGREYFECKDDSTIKELIRNCLSK